MIENEPLYFSFFRRLYREDDPPITFRFIPEHPEIKDSLRSTCAFCLLSDAPEKIAEAEAAGLGSFFVVNPTLCAMTQDKDVKNYRSVFIDIDGAELPEKWHYPPDIILRRSDGGGFHVYWLLETPEIYATRWAHCQRSLISFYNSDPAIKNPARLMRVPYTKHFKGAPSTILQYEVLGDAN